MTTVTIAYTLGNPDVYEPALDQTEVTKCIGGVAYRTYGEAQAVLDYWNGALPHKWFRGCVLPGRVYVIELPGPWDECVCESPEIDAHVLTVEARVRRVVH